MDLKKQTVIYTFGNTVYLIALWLLTVMTTHFYGYEKAGVLTLSMAIGNVIAIIQLFGVRSFQSSDIKYQYTDREYIYSRWISVAAGWLVGILICVFLKYPADTSMSVLAFILLKTSETFSDVFFGNEQRSGHLEYAGYSLSLRGLLIIVSYACSAYFIKDYIASMFITAVGTVLISALVDYPLQIKVIDERRTVSGKASVRVLIDCLPLLATIMIPVLISSLPRVILERYFGEKVLGLYGNVSTPALLLTTVVPTVLIALSPGYGRAYSEKNLGKIKKIWILSILGTALITGIFLAGTALLGMQVMTLVYTSEIGPYVKYLYAVLLSMMIYTICMCNNTALIPMRRIKGNSMTSVVSLIICVLTSAFFVGNYGINGAILVLAVSYGVQALIQTIWILIICSSKNEVQ